MGRTVEEIIARAETLAQGTGRDPSQSPVLDGTMTAEAIYPSAVRYAVRRALASGQTGKIRNLTADHSIEMVDGVGTLPDTILRDALSKSAFFPDKPFVSWLPYPDYMRTRFDNLMCYFTVLGSTLLFSCGTPPASRTVSQVSMTASDATVTIGGLSTDEFTSADVGKRIRITETGGSVLIFDGFVRSYTDPTHVEVWGWPLAATEAATGTAVIYEEGFDTLVKTVSNASAFADINQVATIDPASFEAADIGRRIKVYEGPTVVLDALVESIDSPTGVYTRGAPIANTTIDGATVEIYNTPLRLNAPTIPAIPTDPATDSGLSDELADDVIVTIAAVLKGEMPVASLTEEGK